MADTFADKSALSEEKLALLEILLQEEGVGTAFPFRIRPRTSVGPVPLSYAQESLWFLDQLEPGNPAYIISIAMRLRGPLDIPILRKSLERLVQHHESLRTSIVAVDGRPFQEIHPSVTVAVPVEDLQHLSDSEQEREILRLADDTFWSPFNLTSVPLFRFKLLRLKHADHILLFCIHHIVADGWSIDIFFRQLGEVYQAFVEGKPFPLTKPSVHYADYALWQRELLQGELIEKQLEFWKDRLSGELPILRLPTDRPRPTGLSSRGEVYSFVLSETLTNGLRSVSQRRDATLFMTMMAAFNVLLHRYTAQEDILIGTPVANRNRAEIEEVLGFFVNTLVIRASLAYDPSFNELLRQVRDTVLEALENQDAPFEMVVEALQPERSLSYNPVFQAMCVYERVERQPEQQFSGLTLTPIEITSKTTKFDLTLFLTEEVSNIKGYLEYNTDLFDASTIASMADHFERLLAGIVANPDAPVSALPLLSETEEHQLLIAWNDTQVRFELGTMQQLFEAQVERTPQETAVTFNDDRLSYRQLNRRANQLAHYLQEHGVGPDVLVGIYAERSLDLMIALLGVLKAGGAFLPLDTIYPHKHLDLILQDSGVSLLLAQDYLVMDLSFQADLVSLDAERETIAEYPEHNPTIQVEADHLAYVMYTSGSTGRPKGVMITHQGLANYLNWAIRTYPFAEGQAVPVHSSIGFDLTITGLFAPLLVGQTVKLLPPKRNGANLLAATLLSEHGYSLIKITPTHLSLIAQLLPADIAASSTRSLVIGGEQLTSEQIAFWQKNAPRTRLFNEYGPTETVVGCCVYEVTPGATYDGAIPIGRPVANTQLYILDDHLNPVPRGVVGELFIGGAGVARGYLNQPRQTAERFIPDRFSGVSGARLYRTGDLVRYLPDGSIQYVGRIDDQVKIRGYRVEPGAIEAALGRHSAVEEAVVVVREDQYGENNLIAYLVLSREAELDPDELRQYLREQLPAYMIPFDFVRLDALPITVNQKLDRQALPPPMKTLAQERDDTIEGVYDVEGRLMLIWKELLQVHSMDVTDDFFELGGHSLMAVRLFARIEQEFGTNLPLTSMFQGTTIKHLARLIKQQTGIKSWPSLVAIQARGKDGRLPFYCVHGITGDVFWYGDLAGYVGLSQPFYGLQSRGLDGILEPLTTVEDMAAHYVEEIRAMQPEGPYLLGGYSYGGNVAFEIAQQLHALGQEVALLAILDDVPADSNYYKTSWNPGALIGFLKYVYYRIQDIWSLTPREILSRVRRKVRIARKRLALRLSASDNRDTRVRTEDLIDNAVEMPAHVRHIIELNYRAMRKYKPRRYSGRVTLLRSFGEELFTSHDPTMGWGDLAADGVEVEMVPGSHLGMFREPYVKQLAKRLKEHIDRAQQRAGTRPKHGD